MVKAIYVFDERLRQHLLESGCVELSDLTKRAAPEQPAWLFDISPLGGEVPEAFDGQYQPASTFTVTF